MISRALLSRVLRGSLRRCLFRAALLSRRARPFFETDARRAKARLTRARAPRPIDLCFVLHPKAKGWVLGTICERVARELDGTSEMCFSAKTLPRARAYFFSHHSRVLPFLRDEPATRGARTVAFFTHPRDDRPLPLELVLALNRCSAVASMASIHTPYLVASGVRRGKVKIVLGGADALAFRPHERGRGAIGLSMGYYERKRPDRLLDLVRRLPHRKFLLVGRDWDRYERIGELLSFPNFTLVSEDYSRYPDLYSRFDVFLSLSEREGGPIPLIEAMMSNAVPVATRTGFAPDVIRDGENGYLLDVHASTEAIAARVEEAFSLQADVAATARHLTWRAFAERILLLLALTPRGEPVKDHRLVGVKGLSESLAG